MQLALWWLICNLVSILCLAFYSMVEMACVSLNKSRLHFYAMEGSWRAQLLQKLLNDPSRLFCTTLIAVTIATVIGSECSREFHASIGLDPDLSPLSQVILVIIFGELAPMFAARKYSEHVALLGTPLLYLSSKILFPITWLIGLLNRSIDRILGGKALADEIFLSKDELLKMVEEQDTSAQESTEAQEFTNIAASLFTLHSQKVDDLKLPLHLLDMLPSDATITQLRNLLRKNPQSYTPIYHRRLTDIVGIIHPRNVIRAQDHHRVSEYSIPPWFITTQTSMTEIIHQFRRNNQRMAFVLDSSGKAIGFITFAAILNQLFGLQESKKSILSTASLLHEKTLPGTMTVGEFKTHYGALLDPDETLTLAELMIKEIGHHPSNGESIILGQHKITAKATTLLDIKAVTISSLV